MCLAIVARGNPSNDCDVRLSDLLTDRQDLQEIRPLLKQRAEALRDGGADVSIEDLLALTRKNDTAYVSPADVEKAEWFADLYDRVDEKHREHRDAGDLDTRDVEWTDEGNLRLSPRTLHYIVAGNATLRDGTPYENTTKCYGELKEGAFWAQVLGLVDADAIRDGNNNAPQGPAVEVAQDGEGGGGRIVDPDPNRDVPPGEHVYGDDLDLDVGYTPARVPTSVRRPQLAHDSVSGILHKEADRLVEAMFSRVRWDEYRHQDYYIEVWCEKSGVIPQSLSEEYGVTRRAAGKGEMSYQMCREAVDTADARGQDLVVILVTDYDPKGRDMPKSVSRKIEVEAALHDCEAFVHHAAVTREQAIEYGLRTTMAKEASGGRDNPGRKAYESHKDIFEEAARQDPVEVNAFAGDYPTAFRACIEDYITDYFDADLADRIEAATEAAKAEAHDRLVEAFRDRAGEAHEAYAAFVEAVDEYHEQMAAEFDDLEAHQERVAEADRSARRELRLSEKEQAVVDAIGDRYREELAGVAVDLPDPRSSPREDALLDSRRGFFEQLDHYDAFDIRE